MAGASHGQHRCLAAKKWSTPECKKSYFSVFTLSTSLGSTCFKCPSLTSVLSFPPTVLHTPLFPFVCSSLFCASAFYTPDVPSGSICITGFRRAQAVPYYQQALRINPDNIMALNNLGAVLTLLVSELVVSMSVTSQLCSSLLSSSHCQSKHQEARSALEWVLELSPNSTSAMINLATEYEV